MIDPVECPVPIMYEPHSPGAFSKSAADRDSTRGRRAHDRGDKYSESRFGREKTSHSMEASLIYNLKPPPGKYNGVAVDENSPGIAPFAFHAQHGSTPPGPEVTQETVTGFAACTTHVTMKVRNARNAEETPSLEREGYSLLVDDTHGVPSNGSHEWLRDDEKVRQQYYKEAEALAMKAMPGAMKAIAFNHVRRISRQTEALSKKARHTTGGLSAPSYMCHADSTASSAIANVHELAAKGEFAAVGPTQLATHGETLAKGDRLVVLNLWRLVTNFKQPSPTHLALCDMRSVNRARDAIPYHFLVDGCVGYNYGLDASAAAEHRWCYFPALAADEVIAFKAYDSGASDGPGPEWCFHAACDDPSAPEGCAPRESVEVRVALVFPRDEQ
jgi:hypothetical protein